MLLGVRGVEVGAYIGANACGGKVAHMGAEGLAGASQATRLWVGSLEDLLSCGVDSGAGNPCLHWMPQPPATGSRGGGEQGPAGYPQGQDAWGALPVWISTTSPYYNWQTKMDHNHPVIKSYFAKLHDKFDGRSHLGPVARQDCITCLEVPHIKRRMDPSGANGMCYASLPDIYPFIDKYVSHKSHVGNPGPDSTNKLMNMIYKGKEAVYHNAI